MNEPSDFFWRDEAALGSLVDRLLGERKPFFLERLPAQSPTLTALRKAASGKFWLRVEPAPPTPTLDTESRTINELVKSGRRSDLRRAEKAFHSAGRSPTSCARRHRARTSKLIAESVRCRDPELKRHGNGTDLAGRSHLCGGVPWFPRTNMRKAISEFAFVRLDGQAIAMQIASEVAEPMP
ncbi:MAG: hypothetical protein R3D59_17290 [Paracoccaceae bacterium]